MPRRQRADDGVDEDGHYLLERYTFTYLTSGRDLVRRRSPAPARQGAVIVAGPNFENTTAPAGESDSRGQRLVNMPFPLSYLPGAAEEGRAVVQVLRGATLLEGADATEGAVKALHGPRALHMATHGFFLKDQEPNEIPHGRAADRSGLVPPQYYPENPLLRSGLALAGANKRQSGNDDGVLTALEASQLDLTGTNLVVLSACETGVGKAENGDGVYGLRRAFVMAGAETQVMSLWKVDDGATRELMEAYYRGLAQGGGRSEAMRQVGLAMLRNRARAHPHYWASFIVSGEPAPLPAAPDVPRVQPGPRGCGCEVGARPSGNAAAWLALMAALLSARVQPRGRHAGPAHPPRA